MIKALRNHYPEYLMEAVGLAIFMFSAAFFTTVFETFLSGWVSDPHMRRIYEGIGIGLIAIALIYFPWGNHGESSRELILIQRLQ